MAVEFPPPKWAVDDLIPEGLTILAGRPKIRKSWLALNLALAISTGGAALGAIRVQPGPVLVLALEDTGRRLQDRLGAMLRDTKPPRELRLETARPLSDQGGLAKLRSWLQANDAARLVVIDTLARIRPVTKDQGYSQDYGAIQPLQDLAGEFGVAIVVIHHNRKMKSEDWVDQISGTLGLSGAADGMIGLFGDRGAPDATLKITGRDVEDASRGLRWDPAFSMWKLTDELPMSAERKVYVDILRARPLGPAAVQRALAERGQPKHISSVKTTLTRMVEAEQLVTAGGTYAVPGQAVIGVDHVVPVVRVNPVVHVVRDEWEPEAFQAIGDEDRPADLEDEPR